ncbi:DUF5947 family protein [Nocardioides cheoyonin]|uniref:DUF5947 family protein n=1 Tax=Nocardioides cheoyonin TaxID=3156615 RepID=UPI0032B3B35B
MTSPAGLSALRRLQSPPQRSPAAGAETEERCEFCSAPVDERHGHVADVVDHRLLCVCRPCYLLFAPRGAGGGRYRGVGEAVRRVGDLRLDEATWDLLKIPVDLAFFFTQDGATHAFYPSPAGATESELDLAAWSTITADNPALATLEPDVEAALLRRRDSGFGCHLVPIDLCYELVGVVRRHWTGLAGGPAVWAAIEEFFDRLDARAVPA